MSGTRFFSMNAARLCIDECHGRISGRVYSKLWPGPLLFFGLGEMLLEMDRMFDECGYPQAFQERRSFVDKSGHSGAQKQNEERGAPGRAERRAVPREQSRDADLAGQSGKYCTFDLVIQSRRQTGWQGLLMKTDRASVVRFDSELEFLDCICRALGDEPEWEPLTG